MKTVVIKGNTGIDWNIRSLIMHENKTYAIIKRLKHTVCGVEVWTLNIKEII